MHCGKPIGPKALLCRECNKKTGKLRAQTYRELKERLAKPPKRSYRKRVSVPIPSNPTERLAYLRRNHALLTNANEEITLGEYEKEWKSFVGATVALAKSEDVFAKMNEAKSKQASTSDAKGAA
jgi:hypothetical protein